jgi:uncharacterized membrane protein
MRYTKWPNISYLADTFAGYAAVAIIVGLLVVCGAAIYAYPLLAGAVVVGVVIGFMAPRLYRRAHNRFASAHARGAAWP